MTQSGNLSFTALPDHILDCPNLDERDDHLDKTVHIVPDEVVPQEHDVGDRPQEQNQSDNVRTFADPISISLLPLSEVDEVTLTEVRHCQFPSDGQY